MLDHARGWLGQKDLELMGVDLSRPLVAGNDSAVFKGESLIGRPVAVKVFPYADLHTINWYRGLTNRLARNVNGRLVTLKTDSAVRSFIWKIIPVDSVGLVNYQGRSLPYSVSQFIEGDNLNSISQTDPFWQEFGFGDNIRMWLRQVSGQFNQLVHSGRIKLGTVNVKNLNDVLAVTDVCKSVKSPKGGITVTWPG